MTGEHGLELSVAGRVLDRRVPFRCPAGRGAQRPLRPVAADGDRRVRALHGLRLAPCVRQRDVLARVVRDGLREQQGNGLDSLVEPVEPLLQRRQRDAVGRALHLVPRRAEAEYETSTCDNVYGRGPVSYTHLRATRLGMISY